MSISFARVEANGWTLAVTGVWPESGWSDFQLDPDGARRVRVTVTGPGFDRIGGEAVFNPARVRETLSHQVRPRRYPDWPQPPQLSSFGPWPGYPPLNRLIDEQDNGNGTRTLRLMLHEPVVAGEAVVIDFLAGWRLGLGAQTVAADNLSAATMPLPIARWMTVPYQAVRGTPLAPATSFLVELLGGHVLPEGLAGLCAVRVCVTDGTSRRFSWLSVGTSADGLRCWRGPADLSGLNPGPVALHWSVFPWFGEARHSSQTDPAGMPAASLHPGPASATAGFGAAAQVPLMVGHDPVGSRYGYTTQASYVAAPSTYFRHVCVAVDPAGQATAPADRTAAEALCGFGNTPEAARTAALATPRAANSAIALATLRRLARGLPAANGAPAASNAGDGMHVFFVDGVHEAGTTTIPSGDSASETWPVLEGNGPGLCTVRSALSGTNRLSYGGWALRRNLRLEPGPLALAGLRGWFDGCELHDRAGHASTIHASSAPPAGEVRWYMTGGRQAMSAFSFAHANNAHGLWRSVAFRRQLAGPAIVGCRKTDSATTLTPLDTYNLASGSPAAAFEDVIKWGNDCRGVGGGIVWGFQMPSTLGADGRLKIRRQLIVNNLFERMNGADGPCWKVGENSSPELDVENCILEGNTGIGDRANHFYNEPSNSSISDTFSLFNTYNMNRIANNYMDRWAGKHDCFFDGAVSSLRAPLGADDGNRGRRTHLVQGWQIVFGHMHEGNVEAHRVTVGAFGSGSGFENHGIGAVLAPNGSPSQNLNWPRFRDDRSVLGSGQGFGDYRPRGDAAWLMAGRRAQTDRDQAGRPRGARFASGALEPMEAAVAQGTNARHGLGSTSPVLAAEVMSFDLLIASSRHAASSSSASIATRIDGQQATGGSRTLRISGDERRVRPRGD